MRFRRTIFAIFNVGKAITLWEAIQINPILPSKYRKHKERATTTKNGRAERHDLKSRLWIFKKKNLKREKEKENE